MTKQKKNGRLHRAANNSKHYGNVTWNLVLLGAQSLASYKLFHAVSGHNNYGLSEYVTIVAATAFAISVTARVVQLLTQEAADQQ